MLKVGFIGFGGGSALIPIMEKELVNKKIGLSEAEFTQDTVIANITPGALPVKLAALAGVQLGGPAVALASSMLVALPGAAVTVALLASFDALGPAAVTVVEHLSLGITAFIIYLLGHYVTKVIRGGGGHRGVYIGIAALAYLMTGAQNTIELLADLLGIEAGLELPELSALGLVIVALTSIAVLSLIQSGRRRDAPIVPRGHSARVRGVPTAVGGFVGLVLVGMAAALILEPAETISFLALIALSTISSFGGGEAYVGVADGFFVAAGLVEQSVFYGQVVPVANALPGPILVKVASALGYVVGAETGGALAGLLLAAAGLMISVGACCAVALAVLAGYDRASHSLFIRNVASYILPVICGLLATTAVSMIHSNVRIGEGADLPGWPVALCTVLLAVAVAGLHRLVKVPDILVIVACGTLSLALVNVL